MMCDWLRGYAQRCDRTSLRNVESREDRDDGAFVGCASGIWRDDPE